MGGGYVDHLLDALVRVTEARHLHPRDAVSQHLPQACSGCRVQDAGCMMQGAGCRVQGAGFRVQGAGFMMQGAGCRVQGS